MLDIIILIRDVIIALCTGFISAIPLGPSGIEAVSRCMDYGFKEGFKVSLGAVAADLAYILLINFGLLNLFTFKDKEYGMLWIISGLILITIPLLVHNKLSKLKRYTVLRESKLGGFLSGFMITFINPTTPSIWIFLSGTLFQMWLPKGHIYLLLIILFMISGSIAWFGVLNLLVSKGIKMVNVNYRKKTSKFLNYFIFALGCIFLCIGCLRMIKVIV